MSKIGDELLANERRLTEAWGDALPAVSDELIATVDRVADQTATAAGELTAWAQGMSSHLLGQLASAYRHSKDEKYARAAKAVYSFWLAKEMEEKGWQPPKDPLVIPHRLGDTEVVGWFGALPELVSSPAFDEAFLARIVEYARLCLNYLADNLHEGRNIRMTQTDALFTQGMRLAFLPDSAKWRAVGLRGLNDAFHRQFHPDGSSIEATGWYHYIVMNMALRYWRLKCARPELGLQVTKSLVTKALEYTTALIQPDGEFSRIGDCTAGVHPFQTLPSFLEHRANVRRELGLAAELPPPSQFFPGAKQAFLRESWEPGAMYITFDATHRKGYHWHPARNAIQLHLRDERVIADPGRMSYDATPHRAYACSTRAHSTMNLNGWQQSCSDPSFEFRSVEGYDIVHSLYDGGYWPIGDMQHGQGLYGEHHRLLMWVRGRFVVVIDSLYHTEGEGSKPTIECNWQFGPGSVDLDPESGRVAYQRREANLLMLFSLKPKGMTMSLHEGELEPCRGWVADRSDRPQPAPFLSMRAEKVDPWHTDMATVMIPHVPGEQPRVVAERLADPSDAKFGRIALKWDDGTVDEVYWTRRLQFALDDADGIRTDAAMVHIAKGADGEFVKALVYDGSYLDPYTKEWREKRETFVIGSDTMATG